MTPASADSLPVGRTPTLKCKKCDAEPWLVHKMLDVGTGGTLRMYKCACGEQTWVNEPAA